MSTYVKRKWILTHFNAVSPLNLPGNVLEIVCLNSLGFSQRQRHQCCIELCPPATLPWGDTAAVTPHSKIYRQLGERVYDSIAPLSWLRGHWQWLMREETGVSERKYVCQLTSALFCSPGAITTETIRIPQPCCRKSSKTYRTFSQLWDQSTGNFLHVFPALNKKKNKNICIVC